MRNFNPTMKAERFTIEKMDCYSPVEWLIRDTKYDSESGLRLFRKREAVQLVNELIEAEDKRDVYTHIFGRDENFYKEFYGK